jgi:hypothetical protein
VRRLALILAIKLLSSRTVQQVISSHTFRRGLYQVLDWVERRWLQPPPKRRRTRPVRPFAR